MADNHSKEVRSKNMSHIRSTNSKPEEIVRKYLFSKGFRYRKNVRTLPGCPDIVLPKYHTVIFVNGCFWHKSTKKWWAASLFRGKFQKYSKKMVALTTKKGYNIYGLLYVFWR